MSHAEIFRVRVDGAEKTVTFSPDDFVDMSSCQEVGRHLGDLIEGSDHGGGIVDFETLNLDFREIAWLGSVGLNELIGINRKARNQGVRLVLSNVQSSVRDVFKLTRLERMFELLSPVEMPEDAAVS